MAFLRLAWTLLVFGTTLEGGCAVTGAFVPACESNAPNYPDVYDETEEPLGLFRHDPVEVGHEKEILHGDGTRLRMKTLAVNPPIFEVPDFLSPKECDYVIQSAKKSDFQRSEARGGLTLDEGEMEWREPGQSSNPIGFFEYWDNNDDGIIDTEEVRSSVHHFSKLLLNDTDLTYTFEFLNFSSQYSDGRITRDEFEGLSTISLEDYINNIRRVHPKFRARFSDQTWLSANSYESEVLHQVRERIVSLTRLHRKIVYGGERIQVVKYTVDGHYNAHQDSETHDLDHIPCCHLTDGDTIAKGNMRCKICRYATVLLVLKSAADGGETAFPWADNSTMNMTLLRRHADRDTNDLYNYCDRTNLRISARPGTAIFWYNHLVNESTGWMGKNDEFALHGGCGVRSGEKWVANFWLTAPYAHDLRFSSVYLDVDEFKWVHQIYGKSRKNSRCSSSTRDEL